MSRTLLTILALLGLVLVMTSAITVYPPIGPIEGFSSRLGEVFLGIKYATVSERFTQSVAVQPWDKDNVFKALEEGKACPQHCGMFCPELPSRTCPKKDQYSEDCLHLNIFTPFKPEGKRLPVMVFFHGGNYKQGHAGGPLYHGSPLSSNEVIVVTANYRLGALGYYVDVENDVHGNYGFLDQVMVLRFIEANISAFGGDPKRVTVFGQSAGGGSVAALATSELSKPFLHRAIIMSNPFSIPFRDATSAPGLTKAFRKHSKCDTLECYRQLPIDELLTAAEAAETDVDSIITSGLNAFLPYTPYVDGVIIKRQLSELFAEAADVARVPIIMGITNDEAVPFIYEASKEPLNHEAYKALLITVFGLGERFNKVLQRFPGDKELADHREYVIKLANEFIFNCSNIRAARAVHESRSEQNNVYFYNYSHAFSFTDAWEHLEMCKNRACHAAELPLTFGIANIRPLFPYLDEERVLSYNIHRYLINFAYTGNPNLGPHPVETRWESFTGEGDAIFRIDYEMGMTAFDSEACKFWDEVEITPK